MLFGCLMSDYLFHTPTISKYWLLWVNLWTLQNVGWVCFANFANWTKFVTWSNAWDGTVGVPGLCKGAWTLKPVGEICQSKKKKAGKEGKNQENKRCRETRNTQFMCNIYIYFFFFENRAVYEITWKNVLERGRTQMTIWRIACWVPKASNTRNQVVQ